jgi:hypothetical protein
VQIQRVLIHFPIERIHDCAFSRLLIMGDDTFELKAIDFSRMWIHTRNSFY